MSTVKSKKLQVGTDATSSNNFTIYQPATPDGTLRIGVGNADSPTEVGRFTSTGYKPATAPAFSAKMSANVALSSNVITKLALDIEIFDTNNNYDTSNYRFTPTVAGYYQFNVSIRIDSNTSGQREVAVYKNGSETLRLFRVAPPSTGTFSGSGSQIMYMNGTTDYAEFYCAQGSGITLNLLEQNGWTMVSAHLVQQA